jgi:hypothetical protein
LKLIFGHKHFPSGCWPAASAGLFPNLLPVSRIFKPFFCSALGLSPANWPENRKQTTDEHRWTQIKPF